MSLIQSPAATPPISSSPTSAWRTSSPARSTRPTSPSRTGGSRRSRGPGTLPPRARETLDGDSQIAAPGLVDSHLHIESSLLTPAPFAEAVLRRGTTTIAEDPHEIANAMGLPGVRAFWQASRGCRSTSTSSPRPASPPPQDWKCARAKWGRPRSPRCSPGTACSVWPRSWTPAPSSTNPALERDSRGGPPRRRRHRGAQPDAARARAERLRRRRHRQRPHPDDARTAARQSAARRLPAIAGALPQRGIDRALLALPTMPQINLVTDDVSPDDLEERGHLDQVLRHAIALGLPPHDRAARRRARTGAPAPPLRPGRHRPGYRADVVLADGLEQFAVSTTVSGGRIVVRDGETCWTSWPRPSWMPCATPSTSHPWQPTFRLETPIDDGVIDVRSILSRPAPRPRPRHCRSPSITALLSSGRRRPLPDRRPGEGRRQRFVGLLRGLGLRSGAVATSHAHDGHNLAVIGGDRESMATGGERRRRRGWWHRRRRRTRNAGAASPPNRGRCLARTAQRGRAALSRHPRCTPRSRRRPPAPADAPLHLHPPRQHRPAHHRPRSRRRRLLAPMPLVVAPVCV